jgi:hypothetical protein
MRSIVQCPPLKAKPRGERRFPGASSLGFRLATAASYSIEAGKTVTQEQQLERNRITTDNADLTAVSRAIVVENKWRAQRYGISRRRRATPLRSGVSTRSFIAAGGRHRRAAHGVPAGAQQRGRARGSVGGLSEWLADTTLGRVVLANKLLSAPPLIPIGIQV